MSQLQTLVFPLKWLFSSLLWDSEEEIQKCLAKAANAVLEPANKNEDTARSIEERLINVYSFPKYGDALVVVDYLSLVPVVGLTGMVDPVRQGGEAAGGWVQM